MYTFFGSLADETTRYGHWRSFGRVPDTITVSFRQMGQLASFLQDTHLLSLTAELALLLLL